MTIGRNKAALEQKREVKDSKTKIKKRGYICRLFCYQP